MEVLRERKIVNAGDIIRFEMEGLAAGLPAHKRVLGYDIWFEPLPRTTTQKIKRHEVERLCARTAAHRVAGRRRSRSIPPIWRGWRSRTRRPVIAVAAAALERGIAFLSGCESRARSRVRLDGARRAADGARTAVRTKVPQKVASEIFTVRQLVEALSPTPTDLTRSALGGQEARRHRRSTQSWATILARSAAATDPVLSGLLERRPIAGAVAVSARRDWCGR